MFEQLGPGLIGSALGSVSGAASKGKVPSNASKNMSTTSEAHACFVYQNFSKSLQAYMLNYVTSVTDMYSVYR